MPANDKIIETGKCEIIELTTEERQAFRDAAQPVYDDYTAEHGSELLERYSWQPRNNHPFNNVIEKRNCNVRM